MDRCYTCGGSGHFARQCPDSSTRGRGGVRENRGSRGGRRDDSGYDAGYGQREETDGGNYSRDNGSFSRGNGNFSRGGGYGRGRRFGSNYGDRPERECYECRQLGHIARECPLKTGEITCYRCKQVGHKQQDCPEGGGSQYSGDRRRCFKCDGYGHLAAACDVQL